MRRFLTISFILLALAVSAAGTTFAVHAQTTTGGAPLTTQGGGTEVGGLGGAIDDAAELAASKNPTEIDKAQEASWGFDWIMTKIMGLFAWLVGVAALVLNYAAYYTVVNMGHYVSGLSAVGLVWEILRDIGNILLIFGFLAIGISIIINSSWYGGGQKLLPTLLIAAVFINFSLFAAEAVIDVGNLFATQIYTQINQGMLPNPSDTGFSDIIQNKGIAGVLMNSLGLQAIYGQAKDGSTSVLAPGKAWYVGFMSIILFIITAFVMFALAFMLLARFVILLFLIILSPIGVAGYAVPKLEGWASRWWSTLFQQTIAAPILFLLLYIALRVITDKHFLQLSGGTEPNWTGFLKEGENIPEFGGILLSFMVAIGLMLAVVIVAKNLSAFGAGWATKWAGKLSFGATALGMRSTAGWGSQRLSRAVRSSERLRGTKTGRLLATTFDKGAKASFDIRGAKIGGGLQGAGVDAGATQKGGYRKRLEDSAKAHEAYAKSIEDSKPTRSEQRQIETAKGNREYAERLHKEASSEYKLTEMEMIKLRAEVKRLESLSIKSPETDRALGATRQKLATSETNLATASTKLTQAAEKLADYEEVEKKINADVGAKTLAKAGREEYVKSIQDTRSARFSSWAMFGPGGAVAAKKIIKEKKNTVDLDEMKKWLEEKDKPKDEEEKEEKKEKEAEPKPETPKP